jgi:DNA-binding IclR family transcriptional regulator
MTRKHCMLQLLAHGALTLGECCTITGWPVKTVRCIVSDLVVHGLVVRTGPRGKGVYSL